MKTTIAPFQKKGLAVCSLLAACLFTVTGAHAQTSQARIASEVNSSQLTVLKGSQHPLAQAVNEAGRVPGDTPLTGMSIYFNRSAAQEADLIGLMAAQQNPASPLYHQWLTPDQFASRFGLARSDLDKVTQWLERQGFQSVNANRSHTAVRFSGTVAQFEAAFGTQMHYYNAGSEKQFAPSTALSVPAAIAPVVDSVRDISSFRAKPMHIRTAKAARPGYTTGGSSASGQYVFFAPGDIAKVYDINPLISASVTGAGQTIAIMGQSQISVTDMENFQSAAGLTKKDPAVLLVPSTGTSTVYADGNEGESDLDLEWSSATAPGANIVFVYTGGSGNNNGVFDSISYAVDERIGDIISVSYGACEPLLGGFTIETSLEQAATQGQTVLAASGDQGSTACFESPTTTNPTLAVQEALAVNYPASSPNVTAVGGTEITAANSVVGTYWSEASTSGTGPGDDLLTSATQYIPEIAWNDDSSQYGLGSSGGGASTLFAKPAWQTGVTGIPSDSKRDVPDVALYSSPNYPGYLFCTSDSSDWSAAGNGYPAQTASCNDGFYDSNSGDLTVAGGTSFATPIFAGMLALLNQKAGYTTGQGLVNPELYTLAANSTTYASAFHDVTTGSNKCTAGSTYCSGSNGFSAGTGYDQVTGLGSVDLNNLASAWPANTGTSAALIGTGTTVSVSNSSPNTGVSITFTVTVVSNSGTTTPTGTVSLSIDGGGTAYSDSGTTTTATLSSNGTATYTTSFASAGTHELVAYYEGDSTHAASTGTAEVPVTAPSSGTGTFKLAATPATLTESQGTSGTETITAASQSGYSGTVLLSIDFGSSGDNSLQNLCGGFASSNSSGEGTVSVTANGNGSTTLTLDSNAADCATADAIKRTGMRPMRELMGKQTARNNGGNPIPATLAFASLVLIGFLGRRSQALRNLAMVLAIVAAGLAISACGSSSSSTTVSDPPKGTYTGTITGEDSTTSSITGTTTFSFVID